MRKGLALAMVVQRVAILALAARTEARVRVLATQEKRSDPGVAQDKGDRGGQVRSGDKGGDGAKGQQRSNVDVDVRGRRGDRDRADRRTRVDIDVNRDRRGYRADRRTRVDVDVDRRRRSGGRDVDVGVGGVWV
jgi:hypothetical protein